MATIIYRPARLALLNAQIQMGVDPTKFRFVLVTDGSSFMDEHPATMDAFTALNEAISGSYIRYAPSGLSVTVDIPKDRVYVSNTFITPTFNLEPGETIVGMILYWGNGADSANIPFIGWELPTPHVVKETEAYEFPLLEDGLMEMPRFGEQAYLIGRKNLLEGRKAYTTGFKLALVRADSNYLTIANPTDIGDITNLFAGSGYTPADLSLTLNTDAVRDRIVIEQADVDFGSLGDDTAAIVGGVVYIPASVNGVTDSLVYGLRLAQPINPGGLNFTFPISADGIAYL